jgi:hypothetical protein
MYLFGAFILANTAQTQRGRLKASKAPDGTWRSTRAWVDEYLTSRYERATETQ